MSVDHDWALYPFEIKTGGQNQPLVASLINELVDNALCF